MGDIGNKIKIIRKSEKLSMEDFGKKFTPPASKGVVSNWENGYNFPNKERLKKIAEMGNTTIDELLGNETVQVDIERWQTVFNNHKKILAELEIIKSNEAYFSTLYSSIETTKSEIVKIINLIDNDDEISLEIIKNKLESLETALDEYEISKYEQSETLISNIESNKRSIELAENKLKELGAETTK